MFIAVSACIMLNTMFIAVLAQYMTVTDKETDGRTNGETEIRITCTALNITVASRGKKAKFGRATMRIVGLQWFAGRCDDVNDTLR